MILFEKLKPIDGLRFRIWASVPYKAWGLGLFTFHHRCWPGQRIDIQIHLIFFRIDSYICWGGYKLMCDFESTKKEI